MAVTALPSDGMVVLADPGRDLDGGAADRAEIQANARQFWYDLDVGF